MFRSVLVGLIALMPAMAIAQTEVKEQRDGDKKAVIRVGGNENKVKLDKDGQLKVETENADGDQKKVKVDPPAWAKAHGYRHDKAVYFPDYHIFYTPFRGFIYWSDNAWKADREVPAVLKDVDLASARVAVLEDTEEESFPERDYMTYRDKYPAETVDTDVAVPPGD
jgi:hypothetical protein